VEQSGRLPYPFVFSLNTKENCFLDELFVTETARGKGIGSKAVDFVSRKPKNIVKTNLS
jgi:GNAT superfamily N-acetyltransferase